MKECRKNEEIEEEIEWLAHLERLLEWQRDWLTDWLIEIDDSLPQFHMTGSLVYLSSLSPLGVSTGGSGRGGEHNESQGQSFVVGAGTGERHSDGDHARSWKAEDFRKPPEASRLPHCGSLFGPCAARHASWRHLLLSCLPNACIFRENKKTGRRKYCEDENHTKQQHYDKAEECARCPTPHPVLQTP